MAMASEILIVEDSATQALRLKLVLERAGLAVGWAPNGRVAVEMATEHPPRAVVIDVNLPDLDGFHVCRALRGHVSTAETPLILLTVRDRVQDTLAGLDAGATAYIPKDDYAEVNLLRTLRDLAILDGEAAAASQDPFRS
jgi:DNA-binding response OmpR family regulator